MTRRIADDGTARHAAPVVGVPGTCPRCGGFGYIEQIDMVHRFQRQHCLDCLHRWEFSFDENGVAGDITDLTRQSPIPRPR